jgi:hypothetical protein
VPDLPALTNDFPSRHPTTLYMGVIAGVN